MKLSHMAVGACLPLALAACGSDDGPSKADIQPLPEPKYTFTSGELNETANLDTTIPAGVYQFSTASSEGQVAAQNTAENTGIALISHSGRLIFATDLRQAITRIKLGDDGRFEAELQDTGELSFYQLSPEDEAADNQTWIIKGQRDALTDASTTKIAGTIEDKQDGTLLDVYEMVRDNSVSDSSIALADLAGTFRETADSGITTSLTLTADGKITGSDTTGCQFDGQFIIPNAGVNLLEAKYEVSGCGAGAQLTADARVGTFYALGFANTAESTVTFFGAGEQIATRFEGTDVEVLQAEGPEVIGFVSDNLSVNDQVVQTLHPGSYDFTEILPDGSTDTPDTGYGILSPTGRLFLVTSSRFLRSHIRLSETLTFTADAAEAVINEDAAPDYTTTTIFGAPESENVPFSIVGSLITDTGELGARYRITRDDTASDVSRSLDAVAGSYMATWGGGITSTFTVGADGSLIGSDTTGCQFQGDIFIPDPALNVVEARFNATGCTASYNATGEERNGTFNAVGRVNASSPAELQLMMDNGNYSFVFSGSL